MSDELWSDDRINSYAANAASAWEAMHIAEAMKRLRDDYAARLAELEQERDALRAQLEAERNAARIADANLTGNMELMQDEIKFLRAQAGEWQPVSQSLEYDLITYAIKHGEIEQGYRLCRLVESVHERVPVDIAQTIRDAIKRVREFAAKYQPECSVDTAWLMQLDFDRIDVWLKQQGERNANTGQL